MATLPPKNLPTDPDLEDRDEMDAVIKWQRSVLEQSMRPHEGLRRIRVKSRYSQSKMAQILRVSRRTYQSYETGQSSIPSNVFISLLSYFPADLNEIFSGRPKPPDADTLNATIGFTISVAGKILELCNEPRIALKDLKSVALDYCMNNDPHPKIDEENLIRSIQQVTGDKYVRDWSQISDDFYEI